MVKQFEKKGGILLLEGFDISVPGEYISDRASTNNQNFFVNRGLLTKRNGTTAVPSAGTLIGGTEKEIMAGREFKREGTLFNIRIGRENTERYNTGTNVWDDITGTALTGTSSDLVDTAVPLLSGKTILCITNGIDVIQKYTGSGTLSALGGTPPVPKFIQEYRNYLVCANIQGGVDVAQRVQWSDTANPEEWSTGNSGAQDLVEDGQDITGMNLFGSYLCIHKATSIYLGRLVSSSDIFRFDRIATQVGTIANGSIKNLPTNQQIFLAGDGLRLFDGISAPLIQSPINEEIRDELNQEFSIKAWSVLVREEDEVWIGIPIGSQTTGDTVYKYNYVTGNLYKDTRSNITAAWRFVQLPVGGGSLSWDDSSGTWDSQTTRWNEGANSEGFTSIMLGDNTGLTTQVDATVNNDNGTAINAFWESKDFQLTQQLQARWLEMELWAKGGTIKIEYSTDQGETYTEVNDSPFTLDSSFPPDSSPDKFYFDTWNTQLRLRFSNAVAGETLAIKQFILACVPKDERQ